QFTNYTLDILRQILIAKIKGKVEKEIDFVKEVDIKTIYKLINLFLNAENRIRYANNQALVLEMIIPEMMKVDGEREIEIVNRDVKKRITEPKQEEEKEEVMEEKDIKEVSLNEISKRWDEFINEIKPFNGHLYAFLGGANVKDFNKGILHLEVPFKFHEERIEVPKSRNAISETFKKVYGTNCKVSCVVNPSMKSKKSEADFVLRKLPIIKPKEKEKNVAVNVEAIFEGM
ncbi:MAG: hypothetical protein WCX98_01800, partial [Candidatus Dojkabacteria bacterium]